jgi:antitoxin CptB
MDGRRKQLLWRATHRGIKEMDLIVGGFAETHLSTMSVGEINEFARILEIPDQDLLAWLTAQMPIPDHVNSPLLRAILDYRPAATSGSAK